MEQWIHIIRIDELHTEAWRLSAFCRILFIWIAKNNNFFNNFQIPFRYGRESAQLHTILGNILKKHVPIAPPDDKRYDDDGHFPVHDNSNNWRPRCKFESCSSNKFSRVMCIKFKVHLCLTKDRNCFFNYHHFDENSPI